MPNKLSRSVVRSTALAVTALIVTGCGYGLIGRTSNLPEDVQNIFVEPLQNRTTRSQVDLQLTQAIVDELVTRRRFEVVKSRSAADAVLSGTLTSYLVRPVRFGSDGRATDYEISIRADMLFKRQDSDEIIWAQNQYLFRDDYELQLEDDGGVFDPEDATVQLVARKFAQTLVIDLLEGF